ncbi:4'-phosphopantetheinyl transferase family protein [Streptomyces sp. AN091965]|uniref:4'-phosphopantetheinyl transferase family protein n=1 Tax=Streptomyces sp. AN091965 TaxID=2927803 RepID=UPI001F62232A|nr:4'-phosphopantetheinyl transferase superfamily protein [Streptomyces sp. AN091965]MCI3927950.1 4'-phosphopantetheinyl transferase superfamily protein [Streptomyces sp. AN091965]
MNIPHAAGRIPAALHSAGVDLVDLRRWELALARCGEGLARRYFAPQERCVARELATAERGFAEILGHLFGVKESVVKVVGGLPPTARLADIHVEIPADGNDKQPWTVRLCGPLGEWARAERLDVVGASTPLESGMALAWAATQDAGPRA